MYYVSKISTDSTLYSRLHVCQQTLILQSVRRHGTFQLHPQRDQALDKKLDVRSAWIFATRCPDSIFGEHQVATDAGADECVHCSRGSKLWWGCDLATVVHLILWSIAMMSFMFVSGSVRNQSASLRCSTVNHLLQAKRQSRHGSQLSR